MRATPTATSNGGTMGFYNGYTSVTGNIAFAAAYQYTSNTTFEADISSSGWGTGAPAVFYQSTGYTFAVDLNAEL